MYKRQGKSSVKEAIEVVKQYGVAHVIVTYGPEGSDAYLKHCHSHADAQKVNPIDTSGAGDTFVGALLYYLDHYKQKPDQISPEMIKDGLCFANHAAAIVTTKKGAMNAAPTLEELQK